MRPIDRIVIHHSASPREMTIEQITKWHTDSPPAGRGFEAIAYHLVILGSGVVRAGRDLAIQGVHAKGYNAYSVGVCVVGDCTNPDETWTSAQIMVLRAVIQSLLAAFPGAIVCGHRDVCKTLCPGLDVRALLLAKET